MKGVFSIVLFCFLLGSCSQSINEQRKKELWAMIKSKDRDSIIDAIIEIGNASDTSMIEALLYEPYDPRITHRLQYNGMSIYELKMLTLRDITGIKPLKEITYNPDSTVVSFYIEKLRK